MENTMLTIKFLVFLALELFVLSAMGAALIAGLYKIVRDKVRESRRPDKVAPESRSVTSAGA